MRAFILGAACLLPSCVISTYEGRGQPPLVPLPPESVSASLEEPAAQEEGPSEITASHILVSFVGAMRAAPYIDRQKDEAKAFAEELRKKALTGEDFAQLAQENSDDRGSAATGGALGTFRREQMVPEFSNAAFRLEVGGVSEVIESPYGFHVIKREE